MADQPIPAWLQRAEVGFKILGSLGAVAVPVILFALGQQITQRQKEAEQILRIADYLAADQPRKVQIGIAILQEMRRTDAHIPPELWAMAVALSNGANESTGLPHAAPPPPDRPDALRALRPPLAAVPGLPEAPAPTAPPPAPIADAPTTSRVASSVVAGILPRLFIQIAAADQRPAAEALRAQLQAIRLGGATLVAPGVERVANSPARIELRVLKKADLAEAAELQRQLRTLLRGDIALVDLTNRFDGDPTVKPRTYELWLPPGDVPLAARTG